MKKLLLLSIAGAFSVSAIAQSAPHVTPRSADVKNRSIMTTDNLSQNQNAIPKVNAHPYVSPQTVKRGQPGNNQIAATPIALGSSANAFGNFYIGHQELWYDKNINTVTLFHRNNPAATGDPNTGWYRYDKSTDAGHNWAVDQGPVYGPVLSPGAGIKNGRYPMGVIGNPVGNTDPNNAYEAYTGVWHQANIWHGDVWGNGRLNGASHTENYDSTNGAGNMWWLDDMFATKQNVIWRMGPVLADNQGAYADTVKIDKGVWNGTDYVYTSQYLYFHVNTLLAIRPYDLNIRFSDDGMIGYACVINNGDESNTTYPTGVMYMQMYISTDGGNTWVGDPNSGDPSNTPFDVSLNAPGATTTSLVGGTWFGHPDSTYTVAAFGMTAGDPRPDFCSEVDANGNLHIFVGVYPGSGFAVTQFDPGTWGVADLYTTDHGSSWYGQLVGKPNAYTGNYNDITNIQEGNRPYISRSWDGTKLFYTWFDTDPNIFGTPLNDYPDVYVAGYDISTNMWTPIVRASAGSLVEGACQFGLVSPYVIDSGNCIYTIPVAIMTMEDPNASASTGANGPCDYSYLDDITFNCSDFTITAPNAPILLYPTAIKNDIAAPSHFSVSSNYPNPFNGSTYVDVTLPKSADVTIEVSNMVGQALSTKVYQNLSAGKNKLEIDGSNLAKGVYVYKVTVGQDVVTKTMTVR
jgi:hypothetical protein